MKRRREFNVFSISFLDCICCGLGAMILLYVIVNARTAIRRDEVTQDLRGEVAKIQRKVDAEKAKLGTARAKLKQTTSKITKSKNLSVELIKIIEQKEIELAKSEQETLASIEHVNKLKADLKSLEESTKRLEGGSEEAEEDYGSQIRSFPGTGDRQYLTDLKMGGKRILILVDASASMLDYTIVNVIRRRNLRDSEKLKSPKWRHVVSTVDWLVSNLPKESQFQVYTFNETAQPVIPETKGAWLSAGKLRTLNAAVDGLRKTIPQKGTSLVNAFVAIRDMKPLPDNIFLLVDSLPTMAESRPMIKRRVSGNARVDLFDKAIRKLPRGIPLNIIMYPIEGDPFAASLYWRLAVFTRGSYLSPSKDWP